MSSGTSTTVLSPKNLTTQFLFEKLTDVRLSDYARIKNQLLKAKKINNADKQQQAFERILLLIEQSISTKTLRVNHLPDITYPDGLPVCENVDVIAKAIKDNQVVIIAGETGSGKTTQIPKICLQLGRGIEGIIGHTQPRRIAARTVANRIADELNTRLGNAVGYKVRFNDQVSEQSYIKLMTDGILLAEMRKDRLLRQYDTIIIDEAHERSLNIDFILGYLRKILPKRPDLKVIITSATIDPERFAKHFTNALGQPAPIIEVSGRTFPVEVRYRPLAEINDDKDTDFISGILHAIDELSVESQGDILIFLNGEREIRDTARELEKANLKHSNILPLYSRLTVAEQNLIFKAHHGRNIVLATNVAETSLTVPGIKYVIDTGTARISRYSYRTKVQRLPIEAISQASANQRAGRCGRVSSGICIRLYAENDFNNRAEFTDPEILRTNLATVILQMLSLDLGDISHFPFVQAPDKRNINDGIRLLEELAAIEIKAGEVKLTQVGRQLSAFPIDPRLAKMILTAVELGCIEQVFIIVSALSIQDPRERPHEKQQAADEKHHRFKDSASDFISLLKLWHYLQQQQIQLSNNQFRRLCQKEFLSYIRIREWQDIFSQLRQTLRELKIPISRLALNFPEQQPNNISDSKKESKQENAAQYDLIHQAILSGLLSHIGQQGENRQYKGARNSQFYIFPGSALAKKSPKWLMAAELVETSRLFARMVAKIDPLWLEPMAEHLLKRSYSEPHWQKKQGAVMAFEQVTLYGLIIISKRKVNYQKIEPAICRELFIREALVNNESTIKENFLNDNAKLVKEIHLLEQKARRRDFLIEEQQLYDFYDEKLPETITCQASFLNWWKKQKLVNSKLLHFTKAFLLKENAQTLSPHDYPKTWQQGHLTLPLRYHFSPGDIDDGISVMIPVGILNQVDNSGFDWLIPALRLELITTLIKRLPKALRRNFVPAPNYAKACLEAISTKQGIDNKDSLLSVLSNQLLRMTGVRLPENIWENVDLAPHLRMNYKIVDESGKVLMQGRDLSKIKDNLQGSVQASIKKVADKGIERSNITTWDFNMLPECYEKKVANIRIKAFPALVDKKKSVAIELFEHQSLAEQVMINGVSRLILLNISSPINYLKENLPNKAKLGLYFNPFGSIAELLDDCIVASCQFLVNQQGSLPRTQQAFEQCREYIRADIADCVLDAVINVEQVLSLAHDIRKQLKGKMSLQVVQSHADIKAQLDKLIFKGFVTQAGYQRLTDISRYLTAIKRRLEKLNIDTNQDRLKLIEVEKVSNALANIIVKQPKGQPLDNVLVECRWMIEEFRVSLFAQHLKTAYPISAKRIINHLKTHF